MPRAIIIGAGVAGPAVAQFLTQAGWDCEIFEAKAAPETYPGLFLNVATNGLEVLQSLGLRDRLLSDAHLAPYMEMWSRTGKSLGMVPNGPAGEPDRGGVIVRRQWLHEVIRDGATASGVPIHFDTALESVDQDADTVRATFADGSVRTADVLIGCDGINSVTRAYVDPGGVAPAYSGLVGLGGFASVPGLEPTPLRQHFVFGARSFFGYLVRADGTAYWFANLTSPDPTALLTLSGRELLDTLIDLHSDDPAPVPQILANTSAELRGYPIHDLVGVRRWSRGRVVAIGDAVHATSPSAGQGASLALEDAITVAKLLRDSPSIDSVGPELQRLRQPRADRIVKHAQRINSQKRVTKTRVGVAIRDGMMPMFLRQAAKSTTNNWLYNHSIPWHSDSVASSRWSKERSQISVVDNPTPGG